MKKEKTRESALDGEDAVIYLRLSSADGRGRVGLDTKPALLFTGVGARAWIPYCARVCR